MNGIDHARTLLNLAQSDLKALTGMMNPEIFTDAIFGFHAQQAVEKGLKAWLAALDVHFPWTHDISRLIPLLEEQDKQPWQHDFLKELIWVKFLVLAKQSPNMTYQHSMNAKFVPLLAFCSSLPWCHS